MAMRDSKFLKINSPNLRKGDVRKNYIFFSKLKH